MTQQDTAPLSWHQRNAAGFHRWIGTDDTCEVYVDPWTDPVRHPLDQCMTCGTVCVDTGPESQGDHECLPLGCPGPDIGTPHRFVPLAGWSSHYTGTDGRIATVGGWTLYCETCGHRITEQTRPSDVDWTCHA